MVDLHPLCTYRKPVQLQESMDVGIWPLALYIILKHGHHRLGMPTSDIQQVVEVLWSHGHTPTHMPWWFYIHCAPNQPLCRSRTRHMWVKYPQHCPPTPAIHLLKSCLVTEILTRQPDFMSRAPGIVAFLIRMLSDYRIWISCLMLERNDWNPRKSVFVCCVGLDCPNTVHLHEAMDVATWPSVFSIHPSDGHCRLGMPQSSIPRVVEVLWCHCHTPRHMIWWISIHYAPTQSLYSSRKLWIWPHDPQ